MGGQHIESRRQISGPTLQAPQSSKQEAVVWGGWQGEGDLVHSYQEGRGVEEAEVSDASLQPISPRPLKISSQLSPGMKGPTLLRAQRCRPP